MKKWVQSLFARDKSASMECSPRPRHSQINSSSTIPKARTGDAEANSIKDAGRPVTQRNGVQKVSTAAVTKAAGTNSKGKNGSVLQTEQHMSGSVQLLSVAPKPVGESGAAIPTTINKVAELTAVQSNNPDQTGIQRAEGITAASVTNTNCVIIKASKDLLKDIMSCPIPAKLRFNPQRNENIQQRNRNRKKALKQKMVAVREADDVDRWVLDSPIPVMDDDPPVIVDQSHIGAEAILQQHVNEQGDLQMTVNNDQDTLYTLYASRNRLDVVKLLHRDQMNNFGLVDLVDIRTPAIDGRTCLYAFAANFNLEGVKFCIQVSSSNQHEGWLTAAMAVLSVAAWHQPRQEGSEQFLGRVLSSLGSAGLVHLNNDLPWRQLCLWLPQHVEDGQTLLHFACAYCDLAHISVLLNFGANPNLPTRNQGGRQLNAFEICRELQPQVWDAWRRSLHST